MFSVVFLCKNLLIIMHERIYTAPYLIRTQLIGILKIIVKLYNKLCINAQIFYIDSMLEMPANAPFLRAGMTLYPQSLKNHRLYLKTKSGNAAGYISFRDDRLYYIIIPLLEQKRAQVKVQIATRQDKNNTRYNVKYKNLDFWIKISDNNSGTFPESINMQIEEILTKYSKM